MNLLLSPHLGGGSSLLLTQLRPGRDAKLPDDLLCRVAFPAH